MFMSFAQQNTRVAGYAPGGIGGTDTGPADMSVSKLRYFIALSSGLGLSPSEERTLLDISLGELLRLRATPALVADLNDDKLVRRLNYAIPLLERMRSAAAC